MVTEFFCVVLRCKLGQLLSHFNSWFWWQVPSVNGECWCVHACWFPARIEFGHSLGVIYSTTAPRQSLLLLWKKILQRHSFGCILACAAMQTYHVRCVVLHQMPSHCVNCMSFYFQSWLATKTGSCWIHHQLPSHYKGHTEGSLFVIASSIKNFRLAFAVHITCHAIWVSWRVDTLNLPNQYKVLHHSLSSAVWLVISMAWLTLAHGGKSFTTGSLSSPQRPSRSWSFSAKGGTFIASTAMSRLP